VLNSQLQGYAPILAQARVALEEAIANSDANSIDYWKEQIKTIEDKALETEETLLSTVNDFATKAGEILSDQITNAFDDLARQFYGMTLEDAQASYDRYKVLSADYLQDY